MYVEFQLPKEPDRAAANALLIIRRALVEWAAMYSITYTEKTVKYTHRVCFDNPEHYSFFGITWNPDHRFYALSKFRIVDIP